MSDRDVQLIAAVSDVPVSKVRTIVDLAAKYASEQPAVSGDGEHHVLVDLPAEQWSYVLDALDRFTERYDAGDYELMRGGTQLGSAIDAIRAGTDRQAPHQNPER